MADCWKLHGMVSISLMRNCKYDWFFFTNGFSLIYLLLFCICCNLSAVQSILPRQHIFYLKCFPPFPTSVCPETFQNSFFILNVFLRFLHQFVRKHFRIFVTIMRSKFHFLLNFSTRGTLKIVFCHLAFYFYGLTCWRLTVSQ